MTWRDWRDTAILMALYLALYLTGARSVPTEEDEE